jgi:hypothetical protein
MKPNACWMKALLVVVSLGAAIPLVAQRTPAGGTTKPGTGKSATAAPGAKTEPEAKIAGIVLTRPKGGYLGLTLEGGCFKLSFYDAKKKPATADVARATARWPVRYKVGDERTVLLPDGAGTALISAYHVRPPYVFKLYLSLFGTSGDNAVESYVIDFRQ